MKLTHDAEHEINLIERDPEPEEAPPIPEEESGEDIECLEELVHESRKVRRMLKQNDCEGLAAYLNRNNRERAKMAAQRVRKVFCSGCVQCMTHDATESIDPCPSLAATIPIAEEIQCLVEEPE